MFHHFKKCMYFIKSCSGLTMHMIVYLLDLYQHEKMLYKFPTEYD